MSGLVVAIAILGLLTLAAVAARYVYASRADNPRPETTMLTQLAILAGVVLLVPSAVSWLAS